MAKRLEFDIVTDASKGISGLKQFAGAAKKAMGEVNDSLDDTTTSAQKVAKALSGLADELETEMKGAAKAADALGKALGPELAGRANVDSVVQDLHKMGLTFDQITADADALAGSLKKLDSVQMAGATRGLQEIEDSTKRAKGGVDDIGKSADSSKSALANMIGNSAQDLGAVGGVAGSAGVAIGQMAEYMADAAFEGEGLRSVLGSFAAVAGPILLLSTVVGTITNLLGTAQAEAEASAARIKQFGDALAGTSDKALGLADSLAQNADELTKFDAEAQGFGDSIVEGLSNVGRAVPLIGGLVGDAGQDLTDLADILDRAGLSAYDFAKIVAKGGDLFSTDFTKRLLEARAAGKITDDEFAALSDAVHKYGVEAKTAAKVQKIFNVNIDEANAIIGEQAAPLDKYTDKWNILFADLADGNVSFQATADAINFLHEQLGIPPSDVMSTALDEIARRAEANKQGFDDAAKGLDDFQGKMDDFAVSALDATQAVNDMLNPFEVLGRKSDVLQTIFDLKNAPRKAASAVRDVKQGIDDLSDAMKGIKVGDVLAGGIKADKFLDAIDKLGPEIQARVDEKFGTDGAPAAKKLANSYIDQVTKELGGRFTRAQVATMLGLDDIQATIDIAVDQASLTEATGLLEVLTGIHGNDPWTAQVKLDMAAGNITPDTAKVLIAERLGDFGIDVPTALLPPDGASMDAARESANMYNALHKAQMPTEVTAPENLDFMLQDAQGQINNKPALTVPVKAKFDSKAFDFLFQDAGGITPPSGGIAGERRPEIVDGRYLVVGPTYVPPGTRVTSGARTAHILRHGGGRGLRRYDAGGVVPANVTTNVNLHLPAGSNGADVVRQVKRWQRRNGRAV